MKKILLFIGLLLIAPLTSHVAHFGVARAQTAGQFYTVPTVEALAALTTRPAIVYVRGEGTSTDLKGGLYNWVAGSAATANGTTIVAPSGDGPAGRWFMQGATGMPVLSTGTTTPRKLADRFGLSPLDFGCKGDGVTDDTACMQATLDAASNRTIELGPHLYLISSALSTSNTVGIVGSQGPAGIYSSSCTTGLKAGATNLTLLTLTGWNSSISNVCFQMGDAFNDNSSGAAIKLGVGGQFIVADNQINYPFVGIDVTGSGSNQNVESLLQRNTVFVPSDGGAAIRVGKDSTSGNTVNTRLYDNAYVGSATNTASGIMFLDAGGPFMFGNAPYLMGTGTKIFPGSGQMVAYLLARDLAGDTSYVNELLIDSNGGIVRQLDFVGAWMAGSGGASKKIVRIMNSGAGTVENIGFTGSRFIIGYADSTVSVEAGKYISFTGNMFCTPGAFSATLLTLGGTSQYVNVVGNRFSDCESGSHFTDIRIAGANIVNITGNTFTGALPIQRDSGGTVMVMANNIGLDNASTNLASAASVTLPFNSSVYVTGTTTITSIAGAWSERVVTLTSGTSGGFSITNGANSTCTAVTLTQYQSVILKWNAGLTCWLVIGKT
ncbi:hypothetical protein [Reyranella sp.]|uniref:hypothetical protein n=1 Tax=Reyranella sp. TaxID=1929291 RepID=UPI0011F500B4|nr:hypothetical protein [Reyranella sp.]TAJ89744.1 MAG: hypothetical protein EPO50_05095 [Reyranella sp.]